MGDATQGAISSFGASARGLSIGTVVFEDRAGRRRSTRPPADPCSAERAHFRASMCHVRVYIPATLRGLAARLPEGAVARSAVTDAGALAYAVTPTLREWYREGDQEELEYVALTHAAGASLQLLAASDDAAPRRVVLAADVADDEVRLAPEIDSAAVRLSASVLVENLAALHIDDQAAAPQVTAAIAALGPAAAGDDDAQFTIDELDDHELQWYAVQEMGQLLGSK